MKASDFRECAKKALKGKWGIAIGAFLILSAVSGIIGMIPPKYSWLSPFIFVLLTAPLSVGYCWFYLELKRTPNPKIETMFASFNKDYVRNALASVLVSVFTALWSLLLIVPGIIKAFSYSMTFYILKDRPELTALDAITESRKMMDGKKKHLFFLTLSFIVWFLIPVAFYLLGGFVFAMGFVGDGSITLITLGSVSLFIAFISSVVLSIYLTPYYMTSVAVFYDDFAKLEPTESQVSHETAAGHEE